MTLYNLERLQEVFEPDEIEWRIGQSGTKKDGTIYAKVLAYVSNRAIQNRLDDVFGPLNWQNEFKEWHKDSQICGISVYNDNTGEWVTKWDGADNTNFESTKGGLSDSMKRAGYQWGIGRYLYKLPETFVEVSESKKHGWNYTTTKDKKPFYWKTPDLPRWALPKDLQIAAETKQDNTIEQETPQIAEEEKENIKLQDWIKLIDKKVSHEKIDNLVGMISKLKQPYREDRFSQLENRLKSFGSTYIINKGE